MNTTPKKTPLADKPFHPAVAILTVIGVGIGIFVLVAMLAPVDEETKQKRQSRSAIELCWSEQRKKSATASEARFIAGACERMEEQFRERYKVSP